jgi:diadenosine tetraphosphate (Ap4A) HIT family hydrolase
MEECHFCRLQQGLLATPGGPIYEDELIYAHHFSFGEGPVYLGHLMVETRRHTPDFADLTDAEARAVGLLMARLSHALKVCTGAEKVYAVYYGEVVPHLHIHLTARYPDTPPQYFRWQLEEWPDAPRGGADEVAVLCEQLRAILKEAAI